MRNSIKDPCATAFLFPCACTENEVRAWQSGFQFHTLVCLSVSKATLLAEISKAPLPKLIPRFILNLSSAFLGNANAPKCQVKVWRSFFFLLICLPGLGEIAQLYIFMGLCEIKLTYVHTNLIAFFYFDATIFVIIHLFMNCTESFQTVFILLSKTGWAQ